MWYRANTGIANFIPEDHRDTWNVHAPCLHCGRELLVLGDSKMTTQSTAYDHSANQHYAVHLKVACGKRCANAGVSADAGVTRDTKPFLGLKAETLRKFMKAMSIKTSIDPLADYILAARYGLDDVLDALRPIVTYVLDERGRDARRTFSARLLAAVPNANEHMILQWM